MIMSRHRRTRLLLWTVLVMVVGRTYFFPSTLVTEPRRHLEIDPQRYDPTELLRTHGDVMRHDLDEATDVYFCPADQATLDEHYPLLSYEDFCQNLENSTVNVIPFFGGMTNALKFVVLGAILSLEEGRCFVVSEEHAHLNPGKKWGKTRYGELGYFVDHFFHHIGLPTIPTLERPGQSVQVRNWEDYWMNLRKRRIESEFFTIEHQVYNTTNLTPSPVLQTTDDQGIDGVTLKRDFLRRLWQLRPEYREATCQSLQDHRLLKQDYIAFSIRRGDKTLEDFHFPIMSEYIVEAERLAPAMGFEVDPPPKTNSTHNNNPPKIFVATDDCSVMVTLRRARPWWIWESQCDVLQEQTQTGYAIQDIPDFNHAQREEHFQKFFVELYALALSKVFIGVAYTNVAWFAYFLRPNSMEKSTFLLLDHDPTIHVDPLTIW